MDTRKQIQVASDEVESRIRSGADRSPPGDCNAAPSTLRDPGSAVTESPPGPMGASVASSPGSDPVQTERSCSAEEPSFEALSGAAAPWPPTVVGRYRINRIISCGGMGRVYRAWDTTLHRWVAVKFILDAEADADARERFMVEARATAHVQHPNVLTIYDVGGLDGHFYIVMEYLSGRTLDKLTKPVPWVHAHEIGVALSAGLAAAHRRGVLHRDVKPENAILTDDGQVKLLDFGIATLAAHLSTAGMQEPASERMPSSATPRQLQPPVAASAAGLLMGTPGYMAPESWRGEATARSDVYSLGALLFELCAGRPPHADVPPNSLSFESQRRDAPLLTDVVPTVDPGFAKIVARCLSRNPRARYASAEELHKALRRLERRASPRSSPASDPHRAQMTTTTVRSLVFHEIGPLVVSVLSTEPPTDREWDAYLRLCKQKMAQESIRILVLTAGGCPTPHQRLALQELVGDAPVLAAVVTDAPTVHSIITVLSWRNSGIKTFSPGAGFDDALRYLGVDGSTADGVRREIGMMQREVA